MRMFSKHSLPFGFLTKMLYVLLISPIPAVHLIFPIIYDEQYKV